MPPGTGDYFCWYCFFSLFLPESEGDVFEFAFVGAAVEALVGGWFLQGTQVPDERADLDVVEVLFVDGRGDDRLAAIPGDFELGVLFVDVLRQQIDTLRIAVATHEGDTGNVVAELFYEGIDGIGIERQANVFPEIMAMTPGTVTRAIRDVNCQCHFVGYLLEYYARVDVL